MFDIGTMMQITGSVMGALGAASNSSAAKAAYNSQAQVADNNATISEWQAQDALARGGRDVMAARRRTRQLRGRQRAGLAASGVDLTTGSAEQILNDTEYFGEVDVNTLQDNAAREAWALRNQASGYKSQAGLMKARADAESPFMAGMTSLLTNAGKVASNWYGPDSAGPGVMPPAPYSSGGGNPLMSSSSPWDRYSRSGDAGGETPWSRFLRGNGA